MNGLFIKLWAGCRTHRCCNTPRLVTEGVLPLSSSNGGAFQPPSGRRYHPKPKRAEMETVARYGEKETYEEAV